MASKYENEKLTAVGIYFQEVNQKPTLLREEEEGELLKRFIAGRTFYKKNNDKNESIGTNDWLKSMELTEDARQAYEELIIRNQRLVIKIATRNPEGDLELMDRIQYGNEGLIIALAKFELDMNTRFSTYAVWWIRQRIQRYGIDTGYTIRVPVHIHDRLQQAKKKQTAIEQQLGRKLSDNEFAQLMETSPTKLKEMFDALGHLDSLDRLMDQNDDNSDSLSDCIADKTVSVEETVATKQLKEHMDLLMNSNLTNVELLVVQYYYGFKTGEAMSLRQVGKELGISPDKVGQIHSIALQKLQNKIETDQSWEF